MRCGRVAVLGLGALLCVSLWLGAQPPRSDQRGEYTLSIDVDLVVLHTTVVDDKGRIVSELGQPSFRVFDIFTKGVLVGMTIVAEMPSRVAW